VADVQGAAHALRARGVKHLVLVGELAGGLVSVAAAPSIRPAPDAVISVSGTSDPAGGPSGAQLVASAKTAAAQLRVPLLLVAGKADKTSRANARALYAAAPRSERRIVLVPGGRASASLFAERSTRRAARAESSVLNFIEEHVLLPLAATRGIAVARLGSSFSRGTNYNRYGYVIVGVQDAAAAATLRAKSIVYMSGTSVSPKFFTGVTFGQARSQNWLLKDKAGNYLTNEQYGAYIGDIGSPAYQKQWAESVAAFLSQHGNDGVFIDDVIADVTQLTDDTYPPAYPSQEAWENAELSFIKYVGQALKAKGFYVLVSATGHIRGDERSDNGELTALFWKKLAPFVDGLFSEYWLQLPSETSTLRVAGSDSWREWWDGWVDLVNVAQTAGADFFAVMYGSSASTNIMRYGRASFLLDWNGKGGAFMYAPDEGATDPWNPEWTMEIGRPAGRKFRVGVGWRRNYTGGVTLVNPSPSASQTFSLGRTYYRADGSAVDAITLDPVSAAVLRRQPRSSKG
jgi:hypothetical protein